MATGAAVRRGIFFDHGDGSGDFLTVNRDSTSFGTMKADGSDVHIQQTIRRELDFGSAPAFRLVIKYNMAELYANNYLMNLKRVKYNGRLGIVGEAGSLPKNVEVWQGD